MGEAVPNRPSPVARNAGQGVTPTQGIGESPLIRGADPLRRVRTEPNQVVEASFLRSDWVSLYLSQVPT